MSSSPPTIDPSVLEREAMDIYNKQALALNVVAIAVGTLLAFFGYRFRKTAFFTLGFAGAGTLALLVVAELTASTSYYAWAPLTSFAVAGLLVGLLCVWLVKVGVFLAGAGAGVALAVWLQTAALHRVHTSPDNILFYAALAVLGLVGGLLALKLERPVLIVSTSCIGSTLAGYGVGHFACALPAPWLLPGVATNAGMPTSWWVCLGATIGAAVVSMAVQFFLTGKERRKSTEQYTTPFVTEEYYVLEAGQGDAGKLKPVSARGGNLAYNA